MKILILMPVDQLFGKYSTQFIDLYLIRIHSVLSRTFRWSCHFHLNLWWSFWLLTKLKTIDISGVILTILENSMPAIDVRYSKVSLAMWMNSNCMMLLYWLKLNLQGNLQSLHLITLIWWNFIIYYKTFFFFLSVCIISVDDRVTSEPSFDLS